MSGWVTVAAGLLFCGSSAFGMPLMTVPPADSLQARPTVVRDTTIRPSGTLSDTSAGGIAADTGEFHMKKSPWLAVGLSAAVPGLGQIYDESYWKAPLIWGTAGYWIYEWVTLNNKYSDYRDRYQASVTARTPNATYLTLRNFYRDERDKFAWFLGGLYLLNLVDAYVGAHLYDFDIGPGLTGNGGAAGPGMHATIRYTF